MKIFNKALFIASLSPIFALGCSTEAEQTEVISSNKVKKGEESGVSPIGGSRPGPTINNPGSSNGTAQDPSLGTNQEPGNPAEGQGGLVPGVDPDGTPTLVEPGGDPMVDPSNALQFFEASLLPLLKPEGGITCENCHVGPRVEVANRGPQSIYDAELMYAMVQEGTTSTNNALINKVRSLVVHGGGDQCGDDITQSPCAEYVKFGQLFYKDDGTEAPQFGNINLTLTGGANNWDGNVYGHAFNSDDATEAVTVELYKDMPADQGGVLVGSTMANLPGGAPPVAGNHRYQFKIPDAQITSGVKMMVYAYAVVGGEKQELSGSPFEQTFYVPQAAAFFDANVAAGFNSCGGCHGARALRAAFAGLTEPKPVDGGTATTNKLYLKTSGVGHGGGNVCGGTLCNQIAAWWQQEFGP